ncbi:uncharacterized Nudix hydrolase NudL-like [Clytia hemisphaerica]|uniref:Nudix hydrolase domain-containing protein n=1 Tax=Clytia hemisphaerica TaxID=252671 RepID=A0A7M5VAI8_9CNID|eukprot:TCONS_00012584-protein
MSHILVNVHKDKAEISKTGHKLKEIAKLIEPRRAVIKEFYEQNLIDMNTKVNKPKKKKSAKIVKSAILIPIVLCPDNELKVLLTVRTNRVSISKNEVSFPGGKWERNDESLITTALRESYEEIGLHADNIDHITEFVTLSTYRRGKIYNVYSIIGLLKSSFYAKLNRKEVQDVLLVPLSSMAHTHEYRTNNIPYLATQGLVMQHTTFKIFGLSYAFLGLFYLLATPSYKETEYYRYLESRNGTSFVATMIWKMMELVNELLVSKL